MGAYEFSTRVKAEAPAPAFRIAQEQARHEHGHGGYTGTIAEKDSFVMIRVPEGQDRIAYARQMLADGDSRIIDKWGPAGCIDLGDGSFLFFGLASS